MPPLAIGAMRERITIQRKLASTDEALGHADVPEDVTTIAAEWRPLRATDRLQAGAVQSVLEGSFRVWRRSDLTTAMQIVWVTNGNRVLQILGITPLAGGQWMTLEVGGAE
jgi:head-tail adaptor